MVYSPCIVFWVPGGTISFALNSPCRQLLQPGYSAPGQHIPRRSYMTEGPPWNNQQWVRFGYVRGPLSATTASHMWFERPGLCDFNGGLPMHPAVIQPSARFSRSWQASHSIHPCVCSQDGSRPGRRTASTVRHCH